MREFHTFAERGKDHGVIAYNVASANSVHANLTLRPGAHIAETAVARVVVVGKLAGFRESLRQHLGRAARSVFLHAVMHFDHFKIEA